jgi:hypothetical protein
MNAIPHPLEKFAVDGHFADGACADVLTEFIQDATLQEPDSDRAIGAVWFLLESETVFFLACAGAGIDAEKLRKHLRKSLERRGNAHHTRAEE